MPWRVLFLPLVLAACTSGPLCPSFAETEFVDEVGEPDALEEMRLAFAEFESWTSRPGLCLTEVALVDEVPLKGAGGQYGWNRVLVEPYDSAMRELTLHELCHAWDAVSGNPSLARPDLFPAATITENLELYPMQADRVAEAFAEACAVGPREAAFAHLDAELCDEPFTFDPAQTWLREHVYDAFVAELDARVERGPVTSTRTPLWTEEGYFEFVPDVAPAGDDIAVLWFRIYDSETLEAGVRLVDPVTAAITAEFPLPVDVVTGSVGLLSTDGAPILWNGSPLRAWRLDPKDGTATPLPLPEMAEERMYGHVYGDTAWVLPYSFGEYDEFGEGGEDVMGTPFTVDLTTGVQDALPLPDDTPVERIVGSGDRVSVHVDGRVETWSFGEARWSTTATGEFGAHFEAHIYSPLPDGRLATASSRGPTVLDADGRIWTFPDQPCGASDAGSLAPHVTLGDDMYVVVSGYGDTVDLVRVQF